MPLTAPPILKLLDPGVGFFCYWRGYGTTGGATFSLFPPAVCVYQHEARALDSLRYPSRLSAGQSFGTTRAQIFALSEFAFTD